MIKYEDYPLSSILYYGIGGRARFLLEAESRDAVLEALDFVRTAGIDRLMVVGLGSNLLFPDGVFEGAVLRIAAGAGRPIRDLGAGVVEAFAGQTLDEVIRFGFERGYAGLEWAGGLPGTVGAAVRGNVGAFGGELRDALERAEVLELSGEDRQVRSLGASELAFSYRDSLVKRSGRMVVVTARLRLKEVDEENLARAEEIYRSNIEYRHKNHPMEYPNCGSVFKNIDKRDEVQRMLAVWPDVRELAEGRWHGKVSMGYAINRLGLAGHRIGGAQISPKHNNFIVNLGGASFSDVRALIDKVKEHFRQTFGFLPEAEVEIVGE